MPIKASDNAVAIWDGASWVLHPICSNGTADGFQNGVAVKVGDGYVMVPVGNVTPGANAVSVHAGNENIILPIDCPDKKKKNNNSGGGGGGCSGVDPLCLDCNCDATGQVNFLAMTYTLNISGFPNICTANTFNGSWTVAWDSDCTWLFDIDPYHRVTLQFFSGSFWRVTWAVTATGGHFGNFSNAVGAADCTPIAYNYTYDSCFEPFGCWGLCSGISSGGSMSVSA